MASLAPSPASSAGPDAATRHCRFQGLELTLGPRTASPSSAVLLQAAATMPRGASVHDLGCGSGALALAVKRMRPDLQIDGCDADPEAIAVARANARRLGLDVEFSCQEQWWGEDGRWDLVIANLPYYAESERAELEQELPGEPLEGLLVDGDDPLAVIREVVSGAPPGQRLALQHRRRQAAEVRGLLTLSYTWLQPEGRPVMTVGRV